MIQKRNNTAIKVLLELEEMRIKYMQMITVAVLIDGDNANLDLVNFAMQKIQEQYGMITVRKICANWGINKIENRWKSCIETYDFNKIENPAPGKKNTTDISLILEATKLLHHNIDIFCIVSGDSDFIGLVEHLQANGRYVVGFGDGSTVSEKTKKTYDAYYTLPKESQINDPLVQEAFLLQKFTTDLCVAYRQCKSQTTTVYGGRLFDQYKRIDKVISFRNYNEFKNQIDLNKEFSIEETRLGDVISRNSNLS